MTTLYTRKGVAFEVDDDDAEELSRYTWGGARHLVAKVDGRPTPLHRHIMKPPAHLHVDHVDGDPLNNRRSNLRICTCQENMRNRRIHKNNRLGVKGVTRVRSGKYTATVTVNYKTLNLGTFDTIPEASACYQAKAAELFGSFYRAP